MAENRRFIDVSHTIEDGLITYKGLPAPIICDYLSHETSRPHYAPGTEFQIGKIEMVANTGTGHRPVHSVLLRHDIPIVEHLTRLDKLPDHGFRFFATPVKVKACGAFPVRAFAIV